ncbi:hypothetical protein BV509_21380 [Rhodovulum sulfidophilum]|uniref:DNA-binding protein n=1 Tax=Rhodovulum visakhapatnamense TaxID=364297 RepID=A0ABS1RAU2_9RHOB|nr:hypothetical protein [Rhodovulum visakhapatnamense]MBL3568879.1 hypothetical protein [Rhodovulum visakhapatnamense]MBL3576758.1 hypothetical protein [Rhodovulum visakhapatnamense]OLS42293.1 hypothetical protein BV509_21380 [Rhodovulum sulfidophilum]
MFLNTDPGLVMQHHQHFVADQSAYTAAHRLSPVTLRFPAVMTTAELATWAQVGKNSVPQLVARFGIRELTGHAKNHRFAIHDVLRKIIGVTAASQEDLTMLLMPMQKASWVSQVTGLSTSAVSAGICENRSPLPAPVELTATGQDQAPARGRRWLPVQVEAYLRGDPIPFLAPGLPLQQHRNTPAQEHAGNVFAAICADSAGSSRQVQL